jgi:DNA-binding GntR family transcriptional regulator
VSTPTGARSGAGGLLADRAYEELRDQIVTLAIPPGAPINEELLGRELQMGRTPLREAIKRLALENLISVYPRRGTFVTEINITDLAHISDVRVQLEGHAAYRAAQRLTAGQRDELDALLPMLNRDGDAEALMRLDADVHRFVYRCAGNPYLRETLERYFNLSLRIWYLVLGRLPHLPARVHEHVAMLEAIGAGEAERARAIAAEHVATFEDEIRSVLWPTTT